LSTANSFVAVTGRLNLGQVKKYKAKESQGYFASSYNWGQGVGKPPKPEKGHKAGKGGKGKERSAEDITSRDSSIFAGPVTVSFFTTAFGFPNFRFSRVYPGNGQGAGTSYGYRMLGYVEYRESSSGPQGFDPTDTVVKRHIFDTDFNGYSWKTLTIVRSPENDYNVAGTYTVTSVFTHASLGDFLVLTVSFSEVLRTGSNGRCLGPERFEHSIRVIKPFSTSDNTVRLAVIAVVDHSSRITNYSPSLNYLSAIQILGDNDADDASVGFFAWDRQATCNGNSLDFLAHAWGLTSPFGTAAPANPFTDVDEDHVYFSWSLLGNSVCDDIFWDPSNGIADPETRAVGTADASAPSTASTNAGAIAGGVVGGVALIALIVGIVVIVQRRKNRAAAAPANNYGGDRSFGTSRNTMTYTGYSTLSDYPSKASAV
jgi:hypothetical protein